MNLKKNKKTLKIGRFISIKKKVHNQQYKNKTQNPTS